MTAAPRVCVRLGRLALELPGGAVRVTQEYAVEGVALAETLLDRGGPGPDQIWQQLKAGGATPVEELRLGPGLRGARLQDPGAPGWSTWRALQEAGPVALWLEVETHEDQGEQPPAGLRELAGAYRAPAGTGGDGFHLEHGAVGLPFRTSEQAHARFALPGGELCVTTEAPADVEGETVLERWPDVRQQLSEAGVKVETERAGPRAAGDAHGEELVLRSWQAGELRTTFAWCCADGALPRTVIQLETGQARPREDLAAWDRVLDSLALAGTGGAP